MRAVHLGAAERLLVDDLVDRHLHERRPAEVRRASTLDEHGVVAHPRRVRTAGRVRTERDRDRRDAHLRHLGEVAEAGPALDEQVGLARQIGAGRLVEQDQREPVLLDDLVEALLLAPARRVRRAAAVRHVGAADRHQRVLDDADHVDDAGTDRVLRAPRGQRAQLEQRRVRVDQLLDAFPHQQLLPGVVPVDVALTADGRHLCELCGDGVPQRLHLGQIRLVVVGLQVESTPQHRSDGHLWMLPCTLDPTGERVGDRVHRFSDRPAGD